MKKEIFFIIALGIIFSISFSLLNPGIGGGDFLAYWSAAHLFVYGGNPYLQTEMGSLQQLTSPERFTENNEIISTWNPPWLILFLLPTGILPFSSAIPIWIFCNTLLIGLALLITWKLCEGEQKLPGILIVFLACFLFVGTLSYLAIGQITSIVLLGIVLVIWFLDRDLDIYAGIALLMTTIKPHISYFFLIIVFIWVIKNHRWKVIIGFISTALISMVIFWISNPVWLNNYIYLITNLPYNNLYTSTVGSFISENFNMSIFKYSAVLLLFLIKPLIQIIDKESWLTSTNLALLISLPLSPYGFSFDQIVLLPVIVQLIAWSSKNELSRKAIVFIATTLVAMNLLITYMFSINGLKNYWFFWTPIPLLGVYLYAWKNRDASQKVTN